MKNIDFHISYSCVNSCFFCSEAIQLQKLKGYFVSLNYIKKTLNRKRKQGFDFVNFTGGEPTLHPDFIEITQYAKKIGFKTYIGTNGKMLADRKFCEIVSPYLDEISLSVHGYNYKTHDAIVGRRGSFKDIKKAFQNLKKIRFTNVYSNIVITKKNFVFMDKIISFVIAQGAKKILISNVAPEGRAAFSYKSLAVPLSEWKKRIPLIMRYAESDGVTIKFFGLPLCVIGNAAASNDIFWDSRITIESVYAGNIIKNRMAKSFLPMRGRIRPLICKKCRQKTICYGVFTLYWKLYGDNELTPVL